jgi:hypothetical protein
MMRTHDMTVRAGPPRGRGNYDETGTRWWDDTQCRWFNTTDDEDVLEIDLEDVGHTTMLRSIVTTLTGTLGTQVHRFVGRASSGDPRWADFTVSSGTFPMQPGQPPLDRLHPDDPWADAISGQFKQLELTLAEHGWRPAGRGAHWWSKRYTRPALDWEAPADA